MNKVIWIFLMVLLINSIAFAQTAADAIRVRYPEIGFGARHIAMGGNGVAAAADYSAIYWNPAGLASVKTSEFQGEFSYLRFSNQATFSGNLSDMNDNYSRLRNVGLAIPLPTTRGSLVFAVGYNFVRDYDDYLFFSGFNRLSNGLEFELADDNGVYDWYKFDSEVLQTEEITDEGGLHQWSAGGAIALSPNFDVGVTLNYWSGSSDYHFLFQQEDRDDLYNVYPGDFQSYSLRQNILTDYSAFSMKLGSMFKLNPGIRLGLAVEFPTTFTVKEEYSSSDELVFDDGYVDEIEYEPGEWEYKVQTPYRFDAGIALQRNALQLTAGVTYQDWSQTRFEKPDNLPLDSDYRLLLEENSFLRQDYEETVNYHLGGEFRLPGNQTFLRAGYAVYPSPLKGADSDLDRKYISGGVGFKISPNAIIDMTYQRGSWKRETEDVYTPGGTLEDITENRVFFGIRYGF